MGELGIGCCEQGVVLSDEHGGDQRVVALGRGPQGTCVLYGTRGEQTRDAFGSAWRVSCVRMDDEGEKGLLRVIGGGSVGYAGLASGLAAYFSHGGAEFSDLLDLMDARGIRYAYACADEGGVVSRE